MQTSKCARIHSTSTECHSHSPFLFFFSFFFCKHTTITFLYSLAADADKYLTSTEATIHDQIKYDKTVVFKNSWLFCIRSYTLWSQLTSQQISYTTMMIFSYINKWALCRTMTMFGYFLEYEFRLTQRRRRLHITYGFIWLFQFNSTFFICMNINGQPKEFIQTVGFCHKRSQVTPNTMKQIRNRRRNFLRKHSSASISVMAL